MGLIRTGKHLSADETARLKEQFVDAYNTPVILLSQRHRGPNGKDEATLAIERARTALDRACVAAGFPELEKDQDGDVVHYGIDFDNGEIVTWDGQP